jgi:hypothetical protein
MLRKEGYNFILKTPPNFLLGKFGTKKHRRHCPAVIFCPYTPD